MKKVSMIEIMGNIVSMDIFTARFCCDLKACKGACCVEGNSGAPLDTHEGQILEKQYPNFKPYMTPQGVATVEEEGFAVIDWDGELTTPLINEGECAYTITENGVVWCAIEKAWTQGATEFQKPISCHLYPIRVKQFSNGTYGLQYHRWDICKAAEVLGQTKGEPLFRTLKAPLIRQFGSEFYDALEEVYAELSDETV